LLYAATHLIDQLRPAHCVGGGQRNYPFTNLGDLGHFVLKLSDAAHGHHAIRRDDNDRCFPAVRACTQRAQTNSHR
jgi:hypothetical protein